MQFPKVTDKGALCSLKTLNGWRAAAQTAYSHSMHNVTPSTPPLPN